MSSSLNLIGLPGLINKKYSILPSISEYHFDNLNQKSVKNYSTNNLNGTVGSSSPTVNNKGWVVAEGQSGEIPINCIKPTSLGLSILCYFKATTKTTGMRLFFTDASSTFSLYCYSNDSVGFDMGGSTAQNFSYTYLNNAICCIATFTPGNSIKLFINKTQVASTSISFTETVSIGTRCLIGSEFSGGQNYFNGELYTLITYPFALTQSQINVETDSIININSRRKA